MNKKLIIGGVILASGIASLFIIKTTVHSAASDTWVAKWLEKHPESRDSSGAGRVPLFIKIFGSKSTVL
jgi:hypothetical protein